MVCKQRCPSRRDWTQCSGAQVCQGQRGPEDGTGDPRANEEYADDQLKQCISGNGTKPCSSLIRKNNIYPTYVRQSIKSKFVINLLLTFINIYSFDSNLFIVIINLFNNI